MPYIKNKLVMLTGEERRAVCHILDQVIDLIYRENHASHHLKYYRSALDKMMWHICEDCHQDTSIEVVHDCPARAVGNPFR
jgi:hypothetical protein